MYVSPSVAAESLSEGIYKYMNFNETAEFNEKADTVAA
jgi:aconitase B